MKIRLFNASFYRMCKGEVTEYPNCEFYCDVRNNCDVDDYSKLCPEYIWLPYERKDMTKVPISKFPCVVYWNGLWMKEPNYHLAVKLFATYQKKVIEETRNKLTKQKEILKILEEKLE